MKEPTYDSGIRFLVRVRKFGIRRNISLNLPILFPFIGWPQSALHFLRFLRFWLSIFEGKAYLDYQFINSSSLMRDFKLLKWAPLLQATPPSRDFKFLNQNIINPYFAIFSHEIRLNCRILKLLTENLRGIINTCFFATVTFPLNHIFSHIRLEWRVILHETKYILNHSALFLMKWTPGQ